jgi:hypothetical protein
MQVDKIRLNMAQIYSELGLKSVVQLSSEARDAGKKQALNYTAKKSSQGDQLAKIDKNKNYIPQIALQETRAPQYELTMDVVPKTRVHMQIYKGSVIDVRA